MSSDPDHPLDDLLARLADADPIDPDALPTPTSPRARQLLEDIMTDHTLDDTDTHTADHALDHNDRQSADRSTPVLDLPEVAGIERYAAPRRQRLGVIAAIAAVFIVVTGFVVLSPDGTEPALASVQSAARATAEIESGRASTTFELRATDGTTAEVLSGEVLTEFSGMDIAATIDVDEDAGRASGLPDDIEVRLVDGVIYGHDGTSWYAADTGGTLGQAAVERVDPRTVLQAVQDLVATTEVGEADVDGVDTTHYQSVVDLHDESLRESGWLPVDTAEIEAEGEVTIDLFVDRDGLLRRLVVSGDVAATDGSNGAGTVLVTSSFFDFGADISIEAPEDAAFIDTDLIEDDLAELTPTD